MMLSDAFTGEKYYIKTITPDIFTAKHLKSLGITPGTQVLISTRKGNGYMIISVRGTRIAIEKNIASYIQLEGKVRSRKI